MFYQEELLFMKAVFEKSHLQTRFIEENAWKKDEINGEEDVFDYRDFFQALLPRFAPNQLYKATDRFERSYFFFLLPDKKPKTFLSIGPYLKQSISPQHLLEIGENNGVSPQKHRYLSEYYATLPILTEDTSLFIMINTFCEKIWGTPSFPIVDLTKETSAEAPFSRSMRNVEPTDTLLNKKTIERRYAFENEMIRAVSLGQSHLENQFHPAFSYDFFEKRAAEPLQNAKNYSIIMNTLLRKGAEKGGVHPIYLDQISSEYALKIEHLRSFSAVPALMREMFRSYCRLVRKHTLQKFPLVVQKTILIIDADLSADLSPKLLAKNQGITLGYLSTVFKKETGKTVSEYICERRMEYAEYLLSTTNLQIQTIALHCGIMDAQYFSKLFKKHTGRTPSQYRRFPNDTAMYDNRL